MEITVKETRPVETENGERRVEVLLSNGTTVTILPCYEGFQLPMRRRQDGEGEKTSENPQKK